MVMENSPIKRSPCLGWDLGVISQHTMCFFKSLGIFREGGEVVVSSVFKTLRRSVLSVRG